MHKPIEARLQRHIIAKQAHYTIMLVWQGIDNTSRVQSKFLTYREARDYLKRELPGVPVIHN